MKATGKFYANADEIDALEQMGIQKEAEYEYEDFYFRKDSLVAANIDSEGDIRIFTTVGEFTLKYDEKVWNKITEFLNQI